MYAVKFPNRVIFSIVPVPLKFRDEIQNKLSGKFCNNVTLDVPEDYAEWPDGTEAPDQVLCVAKGEQNHFEVVKYAKDIDRARLDVDGRNWSTVGSTTGWITFMDTLRELNRIASNAEGTEPPDEDTADFVPAGGFAKP
jgi:hypothetical protein